MAQVTLYGTTGTFPSLAKKTNDSGTTNGTTANKLVQSGQNFLTTVSVGNEVYNTTDSTIAVVTAVDSNTTLSLSSDIMVSGENYSIYDTKYIFYPEPTFKWNYQKNNDYEDLPFSAVPIVYDMFTQNRTITLSGVINATIAAEPPGAKSLKTRMNDMEKMSWGLGTYSAQPEPPSEMEVLCLEITFPDSTIKQHFVAIHGMDFSWSGGMTHLKYNITFREASEMYLI